MISSSGVIEGQFTQEQIDELISVLNAGALEVPLIKNPVSEFTVSPTLGTDVREKGFTAIIIGAISVFVVTLGYYLVSGFVADVCLAINIVLVLGTMSLIDATFTLPGLAGIVLTIGMAVDANVLIFERIREERTKGSSLRMAIKNGFEKAFSTIFDANVTTLITAVVLYYIGTDQVKGFAVTLFIGILMSMFCALFVGRLIFEIAEQKRWITDLKMMSLIHSHGFDFIGFKGLAAVASIVLILGGLAAVGMRGSDNLDIDFRGGSMVTFRFDGQAPSGDEVRTALAGFPDLSLEELQTTEEGEQRQLFRIRTTEPDAEKVSQGIGEAFASTSYKLIQQEVTLGELQAIPESEPDETEEASGQEPDLFAGGHEVQISLTQTMSPEALAEEAEEALGTLEKYDDTRGAITAAAIGSDEPKVDTIQLRVAKLVSPADAAAMLTALKTDLEKSPHFEEVNTFDEAVAGETKVAAITAMVFSLVAIIAYLWFRFQRVTFGLAACAALVHDVLCVLGLVAIAGMLGLDYKINLPIVAAFLTIVGYSLNDTIVVFDRIREVRGRNPKLTVDMVNSSLNQTFSRTVLTSITTLIVVIILFTMGGEGIEGFAYCLILGVLVGNIQFDLRRQPRSHLVDESGPKTGGIRLDQPPPLLCESHAELKRKIDESCRALFRIEGLLRRIAMHSAGDIDRPPDEQGGRIRETPMTGMEHPNPDLLALGIQQPWAELVLQGIKTIELRTVPIARSGTIYLYASRTVSKLEDALEAANLYGVDVAALPRGQVVGTVDLAGCRDSLASDARQACVSPDWAVNRYSWLLQNPLRCKPLVPWCVPFGMWFYPFQQRRPAPRGRRRRDGGT